MKNVLWILGVLTILAGCGDGGGSAVTTTDLTSPTLSVAPLAEETPIVQQAFSELEFVENPELKVTPEQTAVMVIEPKDATGDGLADTGTPGVDIIPLSILSDREFAFSIDVDDTTVESVSLLNSVGAELASVDHTRPEAELLLAGGDYQLVIQSAFTSAEQSDPPYRFAFAKMETEETTGVAARQKVDTYALTTRGCSGCNLDGVRLSDLTFKNVKLGAARFAGAELTDIVFEAETLTGGDFRKARLERVSFKNIMTTDMKFSQASLDTVTFVGAQFYWAQFQDAYLRGVKVTDSVMEDSNFINCDMKGFQASNCNFRDSIFLGASLSKNGGQYSSFNGADLRNTNFSNSYFPDADFRKANLTGATFRRARGEGANFREANLTNVDFYEARLQGADFTGAVTTGTNFTGAQTQDTTF